MAHGASQMAHGASQGDATADDGIRVWIAEHLLIDEWHPADSDTYRNTFEKIG
jgi:hypothetical protein